MLFHRRNVVIRASTWMGIKFMNRKCEVMLLCVGSNTHWVGLLSREIFFYHVQTTVMVSMVTIIKCVFQLLFFFFLFFPCYVFCFIWSSQSLSLHVLGYVRLTVKHFFYNV